MSKNKFKWGIIMVGTGHGITKMIIKELKSGEKTGKQLRDTIFSNKKPEGTKQIRNIQKAFTRALNKLLEDKEIEIVGYAHRGEVKQSFNEQAIRFKLSEKLNRSKIEKKIESMDKNESYQTIKNLFNNQLVKLNKLEISRWDHVKAWVFYITPEQIKTALGTVYDVKKMMKSMKNLNPKTKKDLYLKRFNLQDWPGYDLTSLQTMSILLELSEISSNHPKEKIRVWYYPMESKDIKNFFKEIPTTPESMNITSDVHPELYPEPEPDTSNEKRILTVDALSVIIPYYPHLIEIGEKWDKDSVMLNCGFGVRPSEIYQYDFEFERIMDILSTYQGEDKKNLISILAKSLSDEIGALQVFGEFYNQISHVSYSKRLKQLLGIFSEDNVLIARQEQHEQERLRQLVKTCLMEISRLKVANKKKS